MISISFALACAKRPDQSARCRDPRGHRGPLAEIEPTICLSPGARDGADCVRQGHSVTDADTQLEGCWAASAPTTISPLKHSSPLHLDAFSTATCDRAASLPALVEPPNGCAGHFARHLAGAPGCWGARNEGLSGRRRPESRSGEEIRRLVEGSLRTTRWYSPTV
jgi:hypothetical protein